jgi:hypothetical protein
LFAVAFLGTFAGSDAQDISSEGSIPFLVSEQFPAGHYDTQSGDSRRVSIRNWTTDGKLR